MSTSRRRFTQSLLLSAGSTAFHAGRAADAPPNVLFVAVDQMRGDCMGAVGHPNVRTPNLAPDDEDAVPRHTQVLRPSMRPTHRTKMVRTHEWKYIQNETEPPELYRLADARPRERANLAGASEHAEIRRTLERQLSAWWPW